jgi:hypothetical protein
MMFIRCSELESDALAHRGGELVFSIFSVDWELLRKGLIANAIGLFFSKGTRAQREQKALSGRCASTGWTSNPNRSLI